jgi:hypothetical protein
VGSGEESGFAHYARATFFRPDNAGGIQAQAQPAVLGLVRNRSTRQLPVIGKPNMHYLMLPIG